MFSLFLGSYARGFNYAPLRIQGLKRLVLWIQTQTLLVDQGLWIQVYVQLCYCAKVVSLREHGEVGDNAK